MPFGPWQKHAVDEARPLGRRVGLAYEAAPAFDAFAFGARGGTSFRSCGSPCSTGFTRQDPAGFRPRRIRPPRLIGRPALTPPDVSWTRWTGCGSSSGGATRTRSTFTHRLRCHLGARTLGRSSCRLTAAQQPACGAYLDTGDVDGLQRVAGAVLHAGRLPDRKPAR
jgi:hypothetical protein